MARTASALDGGPSRIVQRATGRFFDVNPGKLRKGASSHGQWMRFSFRPPIGNIRMGLGRLQRMLGG